jgi:hypothetical protein
MATDALLLLLTQMMATPEPHETIVEAQGLIEDSAWEATVRGITTGGQSKR